MSAVVLLCAAQTAQCFEELWSSVFTDVVRIVIDMLFQKAKTLFDHDQPTE